MSILNITNLTDNPEGWIKDRFMRAFEELETELKVSVPENLKQEFIDSQIDFLEEQAEETKGKDLLGLIDNYLVNSDYYAEVRAWFYDNK